MFKTVELSAEAKVQRDEDWQDAQSELYSRLGKQVKYLWLQGQKATEGAEKSKRTIRMVSFIEELLRKVQGTQIGQRDFLEDGWVNSGYVFGQPNGTAIDPGLTTTALFPGFR